MDSTLILPVIATLSVVTLLIVKLFHRIRKKFPVKVNCWFCNCNTSVSYNISNSWYCPQCDQYNGFSSDGSYNRLLPEQFNEKLNYGSWCNKTKLRNSDSNGLCRFCNINLELKIHQLAQFIPLNKENYDEEVQQYSDQLERVYRLCTRCQGVLEKTLRDKQEKFLTSRQQQTFISKCYQLQSQPKEKESHALYLNLTAMLSLGVLFTVVPHHWVSGLITSYPPPEYIRESLSHIEEYFPEGIWSMAFLSLGIVVQLCDFVHSRYTSSFVNLLLWVILLTLTQVPMPVDGLVSTIHMLASIVFFITSITGHTSDAPITVAAVKPVQLQKLDVNPEKSHGIEKLAEVESTNKIKPPKSPVSDPSPIQSVPTLTRELTSDDLGFSKLNVSPKRVTRSQTRHFQPKHYGSQAQPELFRPKSVNLTPPKLQVDTSEYQLPVTRSSSQSSGYVSLSHQKYFEDCRSPSLVADNIDSISQCEGALTPYQSHFGPSSPFPLSYGMPFSHFQPYTVMHYTPQHFNKFYETSSNILPSYEQSLSLTSYNVHKGFAQEGRFHSIKNAFSSILFFFLITSNIAILWKVYGEDYFKWKS